MSYTQTGIIPAASFADFGLCLATPMPQLASWVQCLWTTNNSTPHVPQIEEKLYPDAGSSLMFVLSDNRVDVRYLHYTRVVVQRWDTATKYICIRFRPGAAKALLGIDSLACQNTAIDLMAIPHPIRSELQHLADVLHGMSVGEQLQTLQHWLLKLSFQVQQPFRQWSTLLTLASSTLIEPQQLSAKYGFSRRTLERQIRKHSGSSPHQFYSFSQIRTARQRLINTTDSLSNIALDCGYFDQAHFTNAFREHTLETPLQYRTRKVSQISNH